MKSSRSMKKTIHQVVHQVPVVVLERFPLPNWMQKALKKRGEDHLNDEPKRKKYKTDEKIAEVPKLILSKDGDEFKSTLKFEKSEVLNNYIKPSLVSDEVKMEVKFGLSNNTLKTKNRVKKKPSKTKIKQSMHIIIDKIKVHDACTINNNCDSTKNEEMYFHQKTFFRHKTNAPFEFQQFGTDDKLTLLHFERLHKKYFDKYALDTIVIISNIVFMNLLTNMHCISRINWILGWKDKHVMAQNIQFQSVLYIKYVQILDNVLRKNCIDVISIFEDSDYEHAVLMFVLTLFTNLKMFGSSVFKNSTVILKILERLKWSEVKTQNFDHNRIQTTFKSDIFCSCYHELSKLIGEGSSTDPKVVRFWQLFFIPAMTTTTYFRSAIEAILNDADLGEVIDLIEQASNNVRSETGQNSPSSNKISIEKKFIALVNNSTHGVIHGNETVKPHATGLNTPNDITQYKHENTSYPHVKTIIAPRPNTLYENYPYTNPRPNTLHENHPRTQYPTNILATSIPKCVRIRQIEKTPMSVPKIHIDLHESCRKSHTVQSESLSTPYIFQTRAIRTSGVIQLNDSKKTNCVINMPEKSMSNRVHVYQVKSTSTIVPTDLHKSYKKSMTILSDDLFTPHLIHTNDLKTLELNTLRTHSTEIHSTSTTNHEQIHEIKDTSATNPTKQNYLHKKFNFNIKVYNGVNNDEIIKVPNITSVIVDSKTSPKTTCSIKMVNKKHMTDESGENHK